jgi:hypothetical protein
VVVALLIKHEAASQAHVKMRDMQDRRHPVCKGCRGGGVVKEQRANGGRAPLFYATSAGAAENARKKFLSRARRVGASKLIHFIFQHGTS